MRKFSELLEQYIGERGSTTNLSTAITLEKEGKDASYIKKQTGWERGHDNNWKFEIEDGNIIETPSQKIKHLSDIWDSDVLYKYYPQLKNVKINIGNELAYSTGTSISISHTDIYWEGGKSANKISLRGILVHEIQHCIQHLEGWDSGCAALNPILVQSMIDECKQKINFFQKMKNVELTKEYVKAKLKEGKNKEEWYDLYQSLIEGFTIDELISDYKKEIERLQDELDNNTTYYKSKGEQEAYATQRRIGKHDDKLLKNYHTDKNGTTYKNI